MLYKAICLADAVDAVISQTRTEVDQERRPDDKRQGDLNSPTVRRPEPKLRLRQLSVSKCIKNNGRCKGWTMNVPRRCLLLAGEPAVIITRR